MLNPRHRPKRHGANTVEFALVVPILLLLIFGILEYARYLFMLQVCTNAAREGARFAVANASNGVTLTEVQQYVNKYLAGAGSQLRNFTPTGANGAPTSIWCYRADPTTGLPNTGTWNNKDIGSNGSEIDDWTQVAYGSPVAVEIAGIYKPAVPILLPVWANGRLTTVPLIPSSITFDSTQSQYASSTGAFLLIKCLIVSEAN